MSLAHIQDNLRHLRLYRIHEQLETALEEAAKNSVSYTDFLDQILSQEVASKQEKYIAVRTSLAKFPYVKTLESFDFAFQPSIDKTPRSGHALALDGPHECLGNAELCLSS